MGEVAEAQRTAKSVRSFARVDAMSPELRECVHEFGEPIVDACLQAGVRSPRNIRQLVREIWEGPRQIQQRRPKLGTLDWVLQQAGAQISAKTLVRVLRNNDLYIVPKAPTAAMVDASMEEVSNFDVRCTKRTKHARRLQAAILAGIKHLWPDLE